MAEKKYTPGRCDYYGNGRRCQKVVISWRLNDGKFTMSADIWNARETDILCGGQCLEEAVAYFPNDAKAQRMLAVWRRWHLNQMKAGSPAQEEWLRANPVKAEWPTPHYLVACKKLAEAGLNPDPDYSRDGKPYSYGSAWLKEELPAEIVAEIERW